MRAILGKVVSKMIMNMMSLTAIVKMMMMMMMMIIQRMAMVILMIRKSVDCRPGSPL